MTCDDENSDVMQSNDVGCDDDVQRANMCVETVNDGKGVKNPLLTSDQRHPQVDRGRVGR